MFYFLDSGHGGVSENGFYVTAGKRSPEPPPKGIYEGQFNRAVSQQIKTMASDKGLVVQETVANSQINIPNRVKNKFINKIIKTLPKDEIKMVIAIHADAMGMGRSWNKHSGFKVLVPKRCKKSEQFAQIIIEKLTSVCPYPSKGIRVRNDLAILRGTKCPSVLVECGHMTNLDDIRFLNSEGGKTKIATAICEAMEQWEIIN